MLFNASMMGFFWWQVVGFRGLGMSLLQGVGAFDSV